ncbi:MAG: chorismate mutase [Bacilli bacterium]|nr:chorismate mutase [Bacilli bacterium]
MDLKEIRTQIDAIDKQMASLFQKRMELVKEVATYKAQNNLPIEDKDREQELIKRNVSYIQNESLREYYPPVLETMMSESKRYQKRLIEAKNGKE